MHHPARLRAIQKAREYARLQPLFLDTETTGLDPRAEVVEISLVDDAGQPLLDTLVKPTRPMPRDAFQVHGISDAMLATAPTWPEVWPRVEALLQGRIVLIYNADFDMRMLRQSHAAWRIPWEPPNFQAACLMKLYAEYHGEPGSYGSYRWQSLEIARRQCGIRLPNTHRALVDATLAKAVFDVMVGAS